jgi:hypothetical protein
MSRRTTRESPERLLKGKLSGVVDAVFVVAVKRFEFVCAKEAAALKKEVLDGKQVIPGQLGSFWAVLPCELDEEEAAF